MDRPEDCTTASACLRYCCSSCGGRNTESQSESGEWCALANPDVHGMYTELVEILRCPQTGEQLRLEQPQYRDERVQSGWLVTQDGRHRYPIRDFIPRFPPG